MDTALTTSFRAHLETQRSQTYSNSSHITHNFSPSMYAYFAFRLCCRITSLESGFDSCQPYKTVGTAGGGTFLKPVYWNVVVISSSSFKKRRGCIRDWNDGVGKLFYLTILTCWRGDAEKMTWAQFCWHEHWTVSRDFLSPVFFMILTHLDPFFHLPFPPMVSILRRYFHVQKLCGVIDAAESISSVSLIPGSQSPRCHWYRGVKLRGVTNTAEIISIRRLLVSL